MGIRREAMDSIFRIDAILKLGRGIVQILSIITAFQGSIGLELLAKFYDNSLITQWR